MQSNNTQAGIPTATNSDPEQAVPNWLRTTIGIVVFGGLLCAILIGSGVLDSKASASADLALHQLPVKERAEKAFQGKQWKVASQAFREMLAADRFDSHSMLYLGICLHNQDMLDEAKTYYTKAAEFNRYRIYSWYNLAVINSRQENLDEAISCLEQAVDAGLTTRGGIRRADAFQNLHDDPEFERLAMLEIETRGQRRRGQ